MKSTTANFQSKNEMIIAQTGSRYFVTRGNDIRCTLCDVIVPSRRLSHHLNLKTHKSKSTTNFQSKNEIIAQTGSQYFVTRGNDIRCTLCDVIVPSRRLSHHLNLKKHKVKPSTPNSETTNEKLIAQTGSQCFVTCGNDIRCTLCDVVVPSRRLSQHLTLDRHRKCLARAPCYCDLGFFFGNKSVPMGTESGQSMELMDSESEGTEGNNLEQNAENNPKEAVLNFLRESPHFPRRWDQIIDPCSNNKKSEILSDFKKHNENLEPYECGSCGILQASHIALKLIDLSCCSVFQAADFENKSITHVAKACQNYHHVNSELLEGTKIPVCDICFEQASKGKVPKYSYKSGWDFGLPLSRLDLPKLTTIERSSICRVLHFQTLCEVRHEKSFADTRFKRHIISFFSSGAETVAQVLPVTEQRVFVTFVGENIKEKALVNPSFRAYFEVRPHVVKKWLIFLKKNNVIYHDIIISDVNIDNLASSCHGILNLASTVNNPASVAASFLAHNQAQSNTEADDEDVLLLNSHFVEDPEQALVDGVTGLLEKKEHVSSCRSRIKIYANAANEFSENHLILGMGYPDLFPVLSNDSANLLKTPLTPSGGLRHLLLQSDSRWCRSSNFGYFHFDQIRRHSLARNVKAKPSMWERARSLLKRKNLLENLRAALKDPLDTEGKKLLHESMQVLHIITRNIHFSDASRNACFNDMVAMHSFMGYGALYITISPCDPDMKLTLKYLDKCSTGVTESMLIKNPDLRVQEVKNHPAYCANTFNLMIHAIVVIKQLFGIQLSSSYKKSGQQQSLNTSFKTETPNGIFNFSKGLFGVVETQGRGSLHMHMLLWGIPVSDYLSENLSSKGKREQICNLASDYMTVSVPREGFEHDVLNKVRVGLQNCPSFEDTSGMLLREFLVASTVQNHICTEMCFKNRQF